MRVIAGTAKGTLLRPVPGETTRPVSDRVKEGFFGTLGDSLPGARVLDLFAGTGSVGIEALSRGAAAAVFVELRARAAATIEANLRAARLMQAARVVRADVFRHLAGVPEPFDLIYVAPPQYAGLWAKALVAIDGSPGWLSLDGFVVVQIFPKEFRELPLASLVLAEERRYGSTLLLFYQRKASGEPL